MEVTQQADKQVIVIEPASPETIYVPYYDPAVVYGTWPYPEYPAYYFPPAPVLWDVGGALAQRYCLGRRLRHWPRDLGQCRLAAWQHQCRHLVNHDGDRVREGSRAQDLEERGAGSTPFAPDQTWTKVDSCAIIIGVEQESNAAALDAGVGRASRRCSASPLLLEPALLIGALGTESNDSRNSSWRA